MKTINVPKELHKKLKLEATKKEISITELIIKIIKDYLGMACVMIMFVGCGTTKIYTPVDKTNMSRFKHDQKVVTGMGRQDVLNKFGTPQTTKELSWGGKNVLRWTYYKAIHCGHESMYCSVYFDRENKVFHYYNIRMEYNFHITSN